MGRYAFQDNDLFSGTNSLSPYPGFNTGQTNRNQNINLTPRIRSRRGSSSSRASSTIASSTCNRSAMRRRPHRAGNMPSSTLCRPATSPFQAICRTPAAPRPFRLAGRRTFTSSMGRDAVEGAAHDQSRRPVSAPARQPPRSAPFRPPSSGQSTMQGCSMAAWI